MQYETNPHGQLILTLEDRDEALTAAYAVSQSRSHNRLVRFFDRRRKRLVQSLGRRTILTDSEARISLDSTDSKIVFDSLVVFSHVNPTSETPAAALLVHPESEDLISDAGEMLARTGRDA